MESLAMALAIAFMAFAPIPILFGLDQALSTMINFPLAGTMLIELGVLLSVYALLAKEMHKLRRPVSAFPGLLWSLLMDPDVYANTSLLLWYLHSYRNPYGQLLFFSEFALVRLLRFAICFFNGVLSTSHRDLFVLEQLNSLFKASSHMRKRPDPASGKSLGCTTSGMSESTQYNTHRVFLKSEVRIPATAKEADSNGDTEAPSTVDEQFAAMERRHRREMKAMQDRYAKAFAAQEKAHQTQLAQIKLDHQAQLQAAGLAKETAFTRLNDTIASRKFWRESELRKRINVAISKLGDPEFEGWEPLPYPSLSDGRLDASDMMRVKQMAQWAQSFPDMADSRRILGQLSPRKNGPLGKYRLGYGRPTCAKPFTQPVDIGYLANTFSLATQVFSVTDLRAFEFLDLAVREHSLLPEVEPARSASVVNNGVPDVASTGNASSATQSTSADVSNQPSLPSTAPPVLRNESASEDPVSTPGPVKSLIVTLRVKFEQPATETASGIPQVSDDTSNGTVTSDQVNQESTMPVSAQLGTDEVHCHGIQQPLQVQMGPSDASAACELSQAPVLQTVDSSASESVAAATSAPELTLPSISATDSPAQSMVETAQADSVETLDSGVQQDICDDNSTVLSIPASDVVPSSSSSSSTGIVTQGTPGPIGQAMLSAANAASKQTFDSSELTSKVSEVTSFALPRTMRVPKSRKGRGTAGDIAPDLQHNASVPVVPTAPQPSLFGMNATSFGQSVAPGLFGMNSTVFGQSAASTAQGQQSGTVSLSGNVPAPNALSPSNLQATDAGNSSAASSMPSTTPDVLPSSQPQPTAASNPVESQAPTTSSSQSPGQSTISSSTTSAMGRTILPIPASSRIRQASAFHFRVSSEREFTLQSGPSRTGPAAAASASSPPVSNLLSAALASLGQTQTTVTDPVGPGSQDNAGAAADSSETVSSSATLAAETPSTEQPADANPAPAQAPVQSQPAPTAPASRSQAADSPAPATPGYNRGERRANAQLAKKQAKADKRAQAQIAAARRRI